MMSKKNPHFRFKQFTIDHSGSAMKVGTDGVLIGSWVNVSESKLILDIGTGSGLIALMLAQRTPDDARIVGVEISEYDAEQARQNVAASPWPHKVNIVCSSVQQFTSDQQFDLIISNPPFFVNSYQPPDSKRIITRHTDTLPFSELVGSVARLMKPGGTFSVILPPPEAEQFIAFATSAGLHRARQLRFFARRNKPVERLLLEFRREPGNLHTEDLVMYEDGTELTQAYRELTKEFYLKH